MRPSNKNTKVANLIYPPIHLLVQLAARADNLHSSSDRFCFPAESKLASSNHATNPLFTAGHSSSLILNHAVSLDLPLMIRCFLTRISNPSSSSFLLRLSAVTQIHPPVSWGKRGQADAEKCGNRRKANKKKTHLKTPSNVKPRRLAAARLGAFRSFAFHSTLR